MKLKSRAQALRIASATLFALVGITWVVTLMQLSHVFLSNSGPPRDTLYLRHNTKNDDDGSSELNRLYHANVHPTDLVNDTERLHLSTLHSGCLVHKDSIIPWTYGRPVTRSSESSMIFQAREDVLIHENDPDLVKKLADCPDVDIFFPKGLRSYGYCEDGSAYLKYLESRFLPLWVFTSKFIDPKTNRTISYHDLCPRTPLIFFNHYWDGVPDMPEWPPRKPLYLMPNIEMNEVGELHYRRVSVVLCKTWTCFDRVRLWYQQEGNNCDTNVMYTRHSTSDLAASAIRKIGHNAVKRKNFARSRFLHAAGSSTSKGTRQTIECWLSRPDFPPLALYIHEWLYKWLYAEKYGNAISASSNIRLITDKVDPVVFGQALVETPFFLCTSDQEGYGHYINQARAAGGVVITTDSPPMNELITQQTGVLVHATQQFHGGQFLGGQYEGSHGLTGVEGLRANFGPNDVCDAVDRLLTTKSPAELEEMAAKAQLQYAIDTKFFAEKMQELRSFARNHPQSVCTHVPPPKVSSKN